jgi:dinuclear metal center YbgI/SA1388 family protein
MPVPTVAEVLARLARAIPLAASASWDPSGLQLGDASAPVARVGVCHEVTETVVAAVEADPVDLLVTYHPLLFTPTTRLLAGRSPGGRAHRLVRAGVALAVAHTAFDLATGGAADALAAALGLGDVSGFAPVVPGGQVKVVTFVPADWVEEVATAMAEAGAGTIGNYRGCSFRATGTGAFLPAEGASPVIGSVGIPSREEEVRLEMVAPAARRDEVVAALAVAHPYEEPAFDVYEVAANLAFGGRVGSLDQPTPLADLASLAGERLGGEGMRVSGPADGWVQRVAVLPGSGASLLGAARAAGADVMVTGDVPHHAAVQALDRGLAVIDPGHAATERPGMAALAAMVGAAAPALVDLTGLDPTPWR